MNIRPLTVIAEPVTLAQAKLHLRIDDDGDSPGGHPDDSLISGLITAARQHCENFTGCALAQVVYVYRTEDFDAITSLPMPPIIEISSVEYMDESGDWIVVDPSVYYLDDDLEMPGIFLNADQDWPEPGDFANPVRVIYEAGYSDGDSPPTSTLPKPIYQAMLLVIGHLYENREDVTDRQLSSIPLGAQSLMRRYRVLLGMA